MGGSRSTSTARWSASKYRIGLAAVIAALMAVISEEAPAVVQAVWPLNVMQTRTLYVSRPIVE